MHPAQMAACFDELCKIAAESESEPNLNFYERHPKKILGGLAATAIAGGTLYANKDKIKEHLANRKWNKTGFQILNKGSTVTMKSMLDKAGLIQKHKLLPEIADLNGHLAEALKSPKPPHHLSGEMFTKSVARVPRVETFHRK